MVGLGKKIWVIANWKSNKDLLARSMRYFTARFEEPCLFDFVKNVKP